MIERAGIKLTVRANSNAAVEIVQIALAGLRPEKVHRAQGVKLTVSGNAGEWRLKDHSSDVSRKLSTDGDLIYHLTDRIVFHIADKAEEQHCLHAAAVAHDGVAILIPANSGAGKSSLTTWLVANGFDYITDELILMGQAEQIDGLGRPIQIKANGIEAISGLLREPDAVLKGSLANAVPISSLGGSVASSAENKAGMILFPQYRLGIGFSFEQLSGAEAGMMLMANHVNARNLEGHGFRAMMKLIRNTPCYRLEYGGFNSLPENFAASLKEKISSK